MKIVDWPIFNFGTMLVLNRKSLSGENVKMVQNDEKSARLLKTSTFCAALDPSLAIVSTLYYQASYSCRALQSDRCLPYLSLF